MAIKITVSDKVRVKVAGTIADAAGPQPFEFSFLAKRLNADELRGRLDESNETTVSAFLAELIDGWAGVRGDSGDIPYSADALQQLLLIPGLAMLMFRQYLTDCGARAKN